ncbi:MAG: DUF4175 family protein [Phycisphaerae bacterium]
MRRSWRFGAVAAMLLASVVAVPAGRAQSDAEDREELVALQELTKKEFTELTDKMVEVADLLADSDPASARAIRQAVSQAQAAFLAERMDEVAEHLSSGMDTAAARGGEEIVADLRRLLETLLYGDTDVGKRGERIRKWREMLDRIDRMREEQRKLERISNTAEHAEQLDERMATLSEELSDIVSDQQELLDETTQLGEPDAAVSRLVELRMRLRRLIVRQRNLHEECRTADVSRLPLAAGLQKELSDSADSLAEDLRQAREDKALSDDLESAGVEPDVLVEASDLVASASGEMSIAGESLARSDGDEADTAQRQAVAELEAADEKLSAAIEARSGGTPAGKLAEKQTALGERTDALKQEVKSVASEAGMGADTGNLSEAVEQMTKASGELTDNDGDKAADHQRRALEELRDEGYELSQLRRRIKDKAETPHDHQSDEQSDLADQTRDTGKQMSDAQDRSAPGRSDVDSAAGAMDDAADKLSGGDCGGANTDQNEAIDRLDRARDELSEAIAREQEMLQAEQLASIEQMLRQILAAQEEVSASTREADAAIGENELTRGDKLRLTELSDTEGALADDVDEVRGMLSQEGSTVVFPGVLEGARGELGRVQSLLADYDSGSETQRRQANIEADLRAMLSAVRDELSRRRRQGGGGGQCPGGGEGPLIPPLAELRMLRLLQLRIGARTDALAEAAEAGEMSPDAVAEEHAELAERQRRVREMARQVAETMEPGGSSGVAQPIGGEQ